MPRAEEVAAVIVNGVTFRDWTTVAVTRSYENPISQFTVESAERLDKSSGITFRQLKIKPGDKALLHLAGRLAITGAIITRQVAYEANTHALQVIGLSFTDRMVQTTPPVDQSEFKDYTFPQIARKLLGDIGLNLKIEGNPEGIDKPFPRFSITPGETNFEIFERMCRMRNLYFHDDAEGNVVVKRGTQSSGYGLYEGRNILRLSGSITDQYALQKLDIVGQRPSTDEAYGEDANVKVTLTNPSLKTQRNAVLVMEQPGDAKDAEMRGQREMADNAGNLVQVNVTVQGWLADDGDIWLNKVGASIGVYSPMAFPGDAMTLAIQAVTCSQSGQGTLTTINLVDPYHLGGSDRIQIDGLSGGAA